MPTATPNRAITDLDKAIQLKPDHATAYFFRGNSYCHKSDYEGAIADWDKAIQLRPDLVEAYVNRGIAHAVCAGDRFLESSNDPPLCQEVERCKELGAK